MNQMYTAAREVRCIFSFFFFSRYIIFSPRFGELPRPYCSGRALDPAPELGMPTNELDTSGPCPFEEGAAWCEGYVGFRWGDWKKRATPH